MEYKVANQFNSQSILSSLPCEEEFDEFVRQFGFYTNITDEDLVWMQENGKRVWIDWLKDKGFITVKQNRYELRIIKNAHKDIIGILVVWDNEDDEIAIQGNLMGIEKPVKPGGPIRLIKYESAIGYGLCDTMATSGVVNTIFVGE